MSVSIQVPRLSVPMASPGKDKTGDLANWTWDNALLLPPFTLADGSGPAGQRTATRLCYDVSALHVRFDCEDDDIWGTYTERDDPIYDEEAVEVFLAVGGDVPVDYYEFEISPNGVLFDARIHNPTGERDQLRADVVWDCPNIHWQAGRNGAANTWWAVLSIPWSAVAPDGALPTVWRANFYRLERPRGAPHEFICWSPTLTDPADFHKPARFGILELV